MPLFATGRTTGLSVLLGHGTCQIAPLMEGFWLKNLSSATNDLSGSKLCDFMKHLDAKFDTPHVHDILNQSCLVKQSSDQ